MSAYRGKPDNICSVRAFPLMTDAVEKVGGENRMSNNRIGEA